MNARATPTYLSLLARDHLADYALYIAGIALHAFRSTRWIAPWVLFYACRRVIRGRKMRAEPAEALLARDIRAPILYLRSFSDDEPEAEESDYNRGLILRTTEEQLALAFRHAGPFIAVGRPGEPLPELGAARLYAPPYEWQEKVRSLIERARLVVLHLGSTDGFWWELEAVVNLGKPQQMLLFVPLGGGPLYERLAGLMRSRFGIELPTMRRSHEFAVIGEKHPDAYFLYFDKAGVPVLVPVWPGRFQRGKYSDRAVIAAIRPILAELGFGKPPMPLHPYVKWLVFFVLPALLLNYFFAFRPTVTAQTEKLNVLRARAGVLMLQRNLVRLRTRTGTLPADDRWEESLQAQGLIPESMREGYAAHGKLLDPWGFRYHYRYPGVRNADSFDLFSSGADGKEGGAGSGADIGNWGAPPGINPPAASAQGP